MASTGKKQQTLSAFFSRPKVNHKTPPTTPEVTDSLVAEDDLEIPQSKRRKLSASFANSRSKESEEPISTLQQSSGNVQKTRALPLHSPSKRTSRYIFSSSPQQENQSDEPDDTFEQQRKADLHRRFVKKLGKPDSIAEIKRRNKALFEDEGQDDDDAEEEEAAQPEKPTGRGKVTKKPGAGKLTPMEKQVIEIKRTHMDTVLVVEVGYKFRFFGEDARIAAKELSIVCIPGKFRYDEHPSEAHLDRFASASIPVHRLHVHVKRLVAAGHKVGVVRQLETAALKAAGDNRNAPFVRKLTNLYTKGTYIDDVEGLEHDSSLSTPPQSPATGFLLCITEANVKGYGNDEKVHVGIVAVQPATGDVVYDDFEDGFMRSEIETRLLHIGPCEILIVGDLSKATDKMVTHLSGSKMNVFGDKVRIERVSKYKTMAAESHNHISSFYSDKLRDTSTNDGKATKLLDKILGLPEHVIICLSSMIRHMSEYGLENVFDLTKYFQPFSARSHMLINGNTLTSLEIYQNQTDHSVKGSLFWTLDRTQTRFGSRLLRKWVGRPLLDKTLIEARLTAVEELVDPNNSMVVEKLRAVLSRIRNDLEKSLLRIYYGKCTRPELLNVLQSLQMLSTEFSGTNTALSTSFTSELVSSAIHSLPSILPEVIEYLNRINLQAAKSDDKYDFFREEYETEKITEHKFGIVSVEHDLDVFRAKAGEMLGRKKEVDYVTVAGIDCLIEVDNSSSQIKKVPASWAKISGTKKVSRFHPPEVIKLMRERDQHKESLAAACDVAYKDLLMQISSKYQLFRDTILSLATLDCLLSLATVASQPGYTRPTFASSGPTVLNIQGARHPMIEQLLLESYVPNHVTLSNEASASRALLVTGPNMGGKSSYVRSVALISIMAQIGSFVPAESAHLGILDAVFTRMGAFDNMMSGESTFMVELSETSDILKLATDRSLVVLDELGRGTSTHDGVAIAASVLDFLVREKRCLTLFITHYQVLARMAVGFAAGELKNVHMRFSENDDDDNSDENITFLYEVGDGVAHRSYGLNVARLAGLSDRVISTARQQSSSLEEQMRARKLNGIVRELSSSSKKLEDNEEEGGGLLDQIVEAIETL